MARHDVRFTIPERRLGNADIEFIVHQDDARLGVLKVSKGEVVWRPANKKSEFRMRWSKFDDLMQQRGRRYNASLL